MDALDFQVEIGGGSGQSYEVTWRAPDGSETSALTRFTVSADELRALTARVPEAVLASSAQVRRSVAPEERPIQELGRLLFDALLPGNGRALLAAARHRAVQEERRLRVVLRVRPPELARLPWEFLFDEGQNDYVCPTTTLIRHPQVAVPQRPLKVRPPLRILCMAAAPDDREPLAIRAEQQRLSGALAGLEHEGLIELGWTAGDTWRDLRTALRRTGDAQWHVFHFIGHGGFDATAQEGTLRLSGEDGSGYDLGAENLAMVLEGRPSLRLVVLNACETGRSSAADPFSSVAGALMRRGVPAALAMQFPISDRAAEEFSRTFYEGIAHRMPVDAAVTDARQAIRLALRGTLEWGTPVLYMRSLDGLLFDLTAAPASSRVDTRDLDDRYVQGLAALYNESWDEAVAAFRAVVAQNPSYRNGTAKLEEAVRGRRLASLYAAGTGAAAKGDWDAAVEHLGAVVDAEAMYRDAADRLRQARRQQEIRQLRAELADLHRARQWQAVLTVGQRLAQLSGTDEKAAELVRDARRELEEHSCPAEPTATVPDPGSDPDVPVAEQSRLLPPRGSEAPPAEPLRPMPAHASNAERSEWAPWPLRFEPSAVPPRPTVPPSVGVRPVPARSGDVQISARPGARAFDFSRDGTRVVVGLVGGDAQVLDLAGHIVATLDDAGRVDSLVRAARLAGLARPAAVTSAALTPNGAQAATAHQTAVRIWSVTKGVVLRQLRLPDAVSAMSFSPFGHRAVFVARAFAYVWDTATASARSRRLRLDTDPNRVAWSPDGLRFVTAGSGGARVWSVATGELTMVIAHSARVLDVAVSPIGARLAIARGADGAALHDVGSGVELRRFPSATDVSRVAFNGDGTWLVTGGRGCVEVWDLRSGDRVTHRRLDSRWVVETLAFGSDGAARAVVSEPGSAWLVRIGEDHDD